MLSPHGKRLPNLTSRTVSLQTSSVVRKIRISPRTIMLKMVMFIVSMDRLLSRELLVRFHFMGLIEHDHHQCVLDQPTSTSLHLAMAIVVIFMLATAVSVIRLMVELI